MKATLSKLLSLVWPVTRKKLHALVTWAGVAFAGVAVVVTWWGLLGLSTAGKIGATIGMLTTLLAGWQRAQPKLDAAIDKLPIPDDCEVAGPPAQVVPLGPGIVVPNATPTPVTSPQTPAAIRDASKGSAILDGLAFAALLGFLCAVVVLLMPGKARAEPPSAGIGCVDEGNTYCVVPTTAAGWQLNLKDAGAANAVVLVGLTLQHQFGSLPLGLGVYGGLGASTANVSSYQGCVGLSLTNWGLVCVGAQRARFADGNTAWQGMLTLAGQLTYGSSPSALRAAAGQ